MRQTAQTAQSTQKTTNDDYDDNYSAANIEGHGMKAPKPLWSCPKCGAKFVNRNNWHSCGQTTLADWKGKMTPHARAIYDRFESLVAACGEYHIAPAKTRIAFLARVRFGGIRWIRGDVVNVNFALPRPLRSRRFNGVVEVVPGWWVHDLTITDPAQLDDQFAGWLKRSYRLMGMQERLGVDRKR